MKAALSHDWLNGMRGGEKCLEVLCELYPDSPIYTLFYEKEKIADTISRHPVRSSFLSKLPFNKKYYRYYLPIFSNAIESFRLKDFDLVVSTSHCVAKGIRKGRGALHVCYCFTPMRYAWTFFDDYFEKRNFFTKRVIKFFIQRLKKWDLRTSADVDYFIAISHHVKKRIKQYYNREADVIYPPVDTDFYTPSHENKREDFYLVVSALVPYKRVDRAVEAFDRLEKKLVVIGDGPERKYLESISRKGLARFLGWQSNEVLRDYYRRARALVFPGEEDFGIVPLEMQACGGFVIAYGEGGALETVLDGKTGLFFKNGTSDGLEQAVLAFEEQTMDPGDSRKNALRFSRERFKMEIKQKLDAFLEEKGKK